MNSSFDDFDVFDSDLVQSNTPAIQKNKSGSIKQENYIVGLIGVALVLASAWLPWMVVRLPGSSVTHLYDFTTGGGATTFYFLVALPILGGGIAWAAKQRAGLVVASVSSMGLGVLAALLVVWRHRGNIKRLLAGTEPKIGKRSSQAHDSAPPP